MKGWRQNFRADPDKAEKIRFDKKILRTFAKIKTWQILIILLIFILLSAIFLRLNNLNMLDIKNSLEEIVKTGAPIDEAKIRGKIKDLQNYTAQHMNTKTGKIALQNLYDRDFLDAAQKNAPANFSGADYNAATENCMPTFRASGYRAWATCVANAVGTTDASLEKTEVAAPNSELYYVEFAPARISFDAAGISLIICAILVFVILIRLIFMLILKIILKIKYRAA